MSVFPRAFDDRLDVHAAELCELRCSVRHVCGFIGFSSKRDRREVGGVGLDEEGIEGLMRRRVLDRLCVLEGDDPTETGDEAEIESLFGERTVLAETMDDSADVAGGFLAQDGEGFLRGVPGMHDDR